jgi:mono/diheme cytochrome c family protein
MFRAILICASILALAGCATDAPSEAASAAARGRQVARRACAACHALEPGAASPNAKAPGFASQEMRHTAGLEGRVDALTRAGHYGMPPVKLRPAEVQDLVAYVASFEGR